MELDSRKKSRRDRMMPSKSFDTHQVRDRPDGSRRVERLSHLVDGNNGTCLPDGRKGMQVQERLKMLRRKSMPERGRCFSMRSATLSGPRQWTRRGWRQPHDIQRERKESRRTSETPQDTRLGGAQRGSLWLCYARPLAEKQKSEISGKRHRPKPTPWEKSN